MVVVGSGAEPSVQTAKCPKGAPPAHVTVAAVSCECFGRQWPCTKSPNKARRNCPNVFGRNCLIGMS